MRPILLALALITGGAGCVHQQRMDRDIAKAAVGIGVLAGLVVLMAIDHKCDAPNAYCSLPPR
jgi:hypothetical protein